MIPHPFPVRLLAADAFEAMIGGTIIGPIDLYDRDGNTLLVRRDGLIETRRGELCRSCDLSRRFVSEAYRHQWTRRCLTAPP